MDIELLKSLEEKVTNIGSDELYKKQIGNFLIWFSPLTYTDQGFVQAALSATEENLNSINDAKLKALSRSIVGIDDIDLRPYRNGSKVFEISDLSPGNRNKVVKVDLAKYIENKIMGWGQDFVDVAFDVYVDVSESTKKQFLSNVIFDNTKDPRVELAELETKVHELRSQLGLPLLEEKAGTQYKNLQGEPQEVEHDGPVPDIASKEYVSEEEVAEETIEQFASEEDILESVDAPVTDVVVEVPVRSIPVASPTNVGNSNPIDNALLARRNTSRPVRQVPPNAISSHDKPFDATPSVNMDEVIENRSQVPTNRFRTDPSVTSQSVNPRFKGKR